MSKAYEGATQDYRIAPKIKAEPLLFDTPFIENESLTSWIIRAAFNQYCEPQTITYYYWSDIDLRIWHQDIDKGFEVTAPKIHIELALLAKCDESEIRKHTFVYFAKKINGNLYSPATLPWTTPLSKRSMYSRIGYPYCADCMTNDDNAHLSLSWRYSWFICCTKHKRFLQNQCAYCLYPYQPQLIPLEIGKINHCHHCHKKVDRITAECEKMPSSLLLEYQETAKKVCKDEVGAVFGLSVTIEVWFETLMFLINMTRKAIANIEYMFARVLISLDVMKKNDEVMKLKAGLPFDALSVDERSYLLDYAYQLMQKPHSEWEVALANNNVSQNSFEWSKDAKIPSSFKPLYVNLPRVVRKKREIKKNIIKPTPPDVVLSQWSRLKRKIEMEQYYDNHKKEKASKSLSVL